MNSILVMAFSPRYLTSLSGQKRGRAVVMNCARCGLWSTTHVHFLRQTFETYGWFRRASG